MKFKPYFYLALPIALIAPIASGTDVNTSANSNMGYGGVKWTLGDSLVPELVAGYRFASVTNNGATQGGDLSMSVKITGKTQLNNLIHLGKLRAKYFNGIDYLQGEVGGGWDFAKSGMFAGVSAQGPFVNTGVDYDFSGANSFSKSFSPYAGFNSIGIYSRPHTSEPTSGTCPDAFKTQYLAAYNAIPDSGNNTTQWAIFDAMSSQYIQNACTFTMHGKLRNNPA
jgi:hypothetical protein